jgi:hypothetical protein
VIAIVVSAFACKRSRQLTRTSLLCCSSLVSGVCSLYASQYLFFHRRHHLPLFAAANWGFYVLLSWAPSYLNLELGLPQTSSGYVLAVSYASLSIAGIGGNRGCSCVLQELLAFRWP